MRGTPEWDEYIDWKIKFLAEKFDTVRAELTQAENAGDEALVVRLEGYIRDMENHALVPDEYVPNRFANAHAFYRKDLNL